MKEYLRELAASLQQAAAEARRPDVGTPPRVFIPTRPTVLTKGDRVRVFAVVQGGPKVEVPVLFTRLSNGGTWAQKPMKLLGRRTYVADLSPPASGGPFLDYYVSAQVFTSTGAVKVTAPLEAGQRFYTVTWLA